MEGQRFGGVIGAGNSQMYCVVYASWLVLPEERSMHSFLPTHLVLKELVVFAFVLIPN